MTEIIEIPKDSYGFTLSMIAKNSDGTRYDITGMTPWLIIGQIPGSTIYSGQCSLGTYPKSGECNIVVPSSMTSTSGVYRAELEVVQAGQRVELNRYTFVISDTLTGVGNQ